MDKIRLRATFVVEYDAYPENYAGETDPKKMAEIDASNFDLMDSFNAEEFEVRVEPI
jgi:hypothetical protein